MAEEQPEGKVERRLMKIAQWIVPAIIGAAIAYGVMHYNNRLRVMNYYVSSSPGLFPKPDITAKKLAITLDEKPIDNLSAVTIYVAGTDQDLADIPIYVRFAPIEGKPPRLIQIKPKLTPESYEEITLSDMKDGGLRKGYQIKVMNRTARIQFDCLFEGDKAPDVTVETAVKGVEIERDDIQGEKRTTWSIVTGLILGIVTGAGIITVLDKALGIGVAAWKRFRGSRAT